jgi:hypothetical protein
MQGDSPYTPARISYGIGCPTIRSARMSSQAVKWRPAKSEESSCDETQSKGKLPRSSRLRKFFWASDYSHGFRMVSGLKGIRPLPIAIERGDRLASKGQCRSRVAKSNGARGFEKSVRVHALPVLHLQSFWVPRVRYSKPVWRLKNTDSEHREPVAPEIAIPPPPPREDGRTVVAHPSTKRTADQHVRSARVKGHLFSSKSTRGLHDRRGEATGRLTESRPTPREVFLSRFV